MKRRVSIILFDSGDVENIYGRNTEASAQNSVSADHHELADMKKLSHARVQAEDWAALWHREENSYACSPLSQYACMTDHLTEWVRDRDGLDPRGCIGQGITHGRNDEVYLSRVPVFQDQIKIDKSLEDAGIRRQMCCHEDCSHGNTYVPSRYLREPRKIRSRIGSLSHPAASHPYQVRLDSRRRSQSRPRMERVQEIVDYTYVFGRQDASHGNGNLCVLSSRRSLTHSQDIALSRMNEMSQDQLHETHRNMTYPSCGYVSGVNESESKFTEAPRFGYPASPPSVGDCDERPVDPTQCFLDQSASSPDRTTVATQTNMNKGVHNLQTRSTLATLQPASALYNHVFSTRQRARVKQNPCDAALTEESRCSSALDVHLKKGRPGPFGVRSVEDSITAALSCLSHDQIRLLDQATSSILDVTVQKGVKP